MFEVFKDDEDLICAQNDCTKYELITFKVKYKFYYNYSF